MYNSNNRNNSNRRPPPGRGVTTGRTSANGPRPSGNNSSSSTYDGSFTNGVSSSGYVADPCSTGDGSDSSSCGDD